MAVDENEKITPEMNGDDVKGTYVPIADTSEFTYTFTITSVYHSVPVETKMTLTGTISKETTEDLPAETTYSITDLSVAYNSYQIGGDAL
jgi:hypothetical protein